ncbi:MAG: helix-turn-helix domain-containing protein, partial [Victivallales bacterium]|nr:helix-turn-helix domain-containing protein [Victivallales bacterium]
GLKRFIELAGRTQEHLTRSMKKYYDESPTAFINQLRVRKAARLLLSSQQEIWEIMYECGFNSHAYFLKCFRKSFGMSPRQYIKVNRRVFNIR